MIESPAKSNSITFENFLMIWLKLSIIKFTFNLCNTAIDNSLVIVK